LAESVLRPLSKLRPELQSECWRLACKVTERPTHFVVSKIVRVITSAIADGSGNGDHKSKRTESKVTTFLRPVFLLSRMQFPTAELFCHFDDEQQARRCQAACKELINRCELIVAELQRKFPELTTS
jgi:hypothetical protein